MAVDGKAYYGYLFEADKKPTKVLNALLRSIANHISQNLGNKEEKYLVPEKLAAFYKAVGGNYDSLFVDSTPQSISWIYSSIGCQHTLQPTHNDYEPPSIPALTAAGFVRWQSIELLLGPEEHGPFLQTAVQTFNLKHPGTGEQFPTNLPIEAFPLVADQAIGEWHRQCAKTLSEKAHRIEARPDPPPRPKVSTAYTHVRPQPRVSRHNTDAPRSSPDSPYFDPRASPSVRPATGYAHVPRSVRPNLVSTPSHRARQFLAPEDLSPRMARSRRRSYPENMGSPVGETPSVQPPEPPSRHGHTDRDHVRRHSHPRHARRGSVSSDASDSSAGDSPKTRRSPMENGGHSPKPVHIPVGVRYVPQPEVHSRGTHRERERDEDVKRRSFPPPVDVPGKFSAPFLFGRKESVRERERVHRSTSRGGGGLKWRDLDGVAAEEVWRRGSTEEDESPRPRTAGTAGVKREKSARESDRTGSEREREKGKRRERERPVTSGEGSERVRERDRERRDRDGNLKGRPVTSRGGSHERSFRERDREPIRGVDGRRYPSHHG